MSCATVMRSPSGKEPTRKSRRLPLARSMTASASGTVNCSSGSRALGVQALGHHLDRLERQAERRVAAGDALGLHLRGEAHDVVPGLGLARGPGAVAAVFGIGGVRAAAGGSGTIRRLCR